MNDFYFVVRCSDGANEGLM